MLASFTAGAACGLITFGELGARFAQRGLLIAALALYALVSLLCAQAGDIGTLIALRFVQGAAGSAAAVFAPAMIRAAYGDAGAVRALGVLGSIEALTPALAPIAGMWMLGLYGWRASFDIIAGLAMIVAVALAFTPLPRSAPAPRGHGYVRLLRSPVFLRYALSQAGTLGGLLVFVFGAPTVFVRTMGGTLTDFITMQTIGIGLFILAANGTGRIAARIGPERMIWRGTLMAAASPVAMTLYALAGGNRVIVVTVLFFAFNFGLGLRGPNGFHRAIVAAGGDDARGAALTVVAILGVTALGTALVAPFVTVGLIALAIGAAVPALIALLLLQVLPPLP